MRIMLGGNGMKKYDSIPRYGKTGTQNILNKNVVIMEKLDGANASFGVVDGELKAFSRNQELDEHNTLRGFYGWVKDNIDASNLAEDTIYFGEWLAPHFVKYRKEHHHQFYLFDIYDAHENTYVPYEIAEAHAGELRLNMPQVFFFGKLNDFSEVEKYVGMSELTEVPNTGEGVVIKSYDDECLFVKIVSDKFKETKAIKQPSLSKTDLDNVIDGVLTSHRVEKLIHKKIDLGLLPSELDITDTGSVLKALGSDVVDDIFEEEMNIFLDMLKKKISRKTPVIVRDILNNGFGGK